MKKHTKIALSIFSLFFGVFALSSCTRSFCSVADQAHMLYAVDNGVTKYTDDASVEGAVALDGFTNIYYTTYIREKSTLETVNTSAAKSGLKIPSLNYWHALDVEVLKLALGEGTDYTSYTLTDIQTALNDYGYYKYYDSSIGVAAKKLKLWTNWDNLNEKTRQNSNISIDECATKDYVTLYKSTLNRAIANRRSCIAIKSGEYGYYGKGENGEDIKAYIEAKSWGYAWTINGVSIFEGLLVYPIAWLVETFCSLMLSGGVIAGLAQLLAILIVTFIIRGMMLLVTIKQTKSTAKMQEINPELSKIQQKYPNANTNRYEKQKLAEETQALYRKHGINPLSSFLVMIVQFPVFICVWGALQGSAQLSTGSFLGLYLSDSISSVLFTWSNWSNPASGVWTALVLFLLMAAAQVTAMLLPQILQKKNQQKVAKLGKNPTQDKNQSTMKMFTYVMMAMIIIMGFSLASAMGVYWLVGALFSICQTLIMHFINKKKQKFRR